MRVIVNPRAGRGRGEKLSRELERRLRTLGSPFSILETRFPGHATELAAQAAREGCSHLAVLGGDGTITEVVNGLVGSEVVLGLLSVGTGNDLARSLALPYNDLASSLRVVLNGRVGSIDVGRDGDRYFVSALGVGYPADVAAETNRLQWLKGPPAFFLAVYKALNRMRVAALRIELDDRVLEVDCTSLLIQNTPFTGGGLKMAPEAKLDDGLFDVVVIDSIGRLDLMLNFPRVYRGSHLDHPNFSLYRSRRVRVTAETPLHKMCDGDVAGWLPVDAEVLPGALKVVLPAEPSSEKI